MLGRVAGAGGGHQGAGGVGLQLVRELVLAGVAGVRRPRGSFRLGRLAAQGEATPGRLGISTLGTPDVVWVRAATRRPAAGGLRRWWFRRWLPARRPGRPGPGSRAGPLLRRRLRLRRGLQTYPLVRPGSGRWWLRSRGKKLSGLFRLVFLAAQGEASSDDNLSTSLNLYGLYRFLHSCESRG